MRYCQTSLSKFLSDKSFIQVYVLSVFFFLMVGFKPALSQKAHISGRVLTTKSKPIPLASVAVYQTFSEPPITGATTDSSGYFSLNLKPGQYRLKITFLSFEPFTKKLTLSVGENVKLGTIHLESKSESLKEIMVKGQHPPMQLSFEKRVFVVGQDITSIGGSVLDVLNSVPSLTADFKGNISLRGSSSVNVLIDGKPSSIYKNGSKALQSLQANQIQEVQIITNPSAKYSSEGSAGIINIILKKNKDYGFHGSVGATQRHPEATSLTTNLNYKKDTVNWFLGGNIAYNKDPAHSRTYQRFNSADTSYVYREISDGNETDYHGNLNLGADWHLTEQQTLTAETALFFEDKKDIFNGVYIDSTLNGRFLDRINRHERIDGGEGGREASLEYENQLGGENHTLSASANYEFSQEKELPNIWESNVNTPADTAYHQISDIRKGHELHFQSDYVQPVDDSSKVEAGFRNTFNWSDNNYSTYERQNGQLVTLPAFNNNYTAYENTNAAYGKFSSNFGAFSYQVGLRAEQYHIQTKLKKSADEIRHTYTNLFPSGFLTYHLNANQSLQMSYSRRIFRPYARLLLPTFSYNDSRSRFTGNPDLSPEYGSSYELQFLQYWDSGSLLSSVYYRHRTGVIEQIQSLNKQGIVLTTPINLSTDNAWGIEITADKEFSNGLKLSGSANLFRSESNGVYQGTKYHAVTSRLTGRLGLNWEITNGFKYQAYVRYYGPEKTIQGRRSPTTFVNMAIAKDLFNQKATISINSEDLFNTRQQEFTITNSQYFSRQKYRETSGIRLHFIYRINQEYEEEE